MLFHCSVFFYFLGTLLVIISFILFVVVVVVVVVVVLLVVVVVVVFSVWVILLVQYTHAYTLSQHSLFHPLPIRRSHWL